MGGQRREKCNKAEQQREQRREVHVFLSYMQLPDALGKQSFREIASLLPFSFFFSSFVFFFFLSFLFSFLLC